LHRSMAEALCAVARLPAWPPCTDLVLFAPRSVDRDVVSSACVDAACGLLQACDPVDRPVCLLGRAFSLFWQAPVHLSASRPQLFPLPPPLPWTNPSPLPPLTTDLCAFTPRIRLTRR
jgi:hypothetical protein